MQIHCIKTREVKNFFSFDSILFDHIYMNTTIKVCTQILPHNIMSPFTSLSSNYSEGLLTTLHPLLTGISLLHELIPGLS